MYAFWKLGGNCTGSVCFSYIVHIIFKLKVQKYFSTLLGKSCKVICSGRKMKVCEKDLADKANRQKILMMIYIVGKRHIGYFSSRP